MIVPLQKNEKCKMESKVDSLAEANKSERREEEKEKLELEE